MLNWAWKKDYNLGASSGLILLKRLFSPTSDSSRAVVSYWLKYEYTKACVKQPLKNRQNKDLNDKW